MRQVAGGDTDALIADDGLWPVGAGRHFKADVAARWAVPDRVNDEVVQHPLQSRHIELPEYRRRIAPVETPRRRIRRTSRLRPELATSSRSRAFSRPRHHSHRHATHPPPAANHPPRLLPFG